MDIPLQRTARAIASALPAEPLAIPELYIESCQNYASAIDARLVNPCACSVYLAHVPAVAHIDRPLEIELAAAHPATLAASTARFISTRATLQVAVGQARVAHSVPVSARLSGEGWVARALIHPSAWASADHIALVGITLAGRSLPSDPLSAFLRVGYNHDPELDGAVHKAIWDSDVQALQVALDGGGSTEGADRVRGKEDGSHGMSK